MSYTNWPIAYEMERFDKTYEEVVEAREERAEAARDRRIDDELTETQDD